MSFLTNKAKSFLQLLVRPLYRRKSKKHFKSERHYFEAKFNTALSLYNKNNKKGIRFFSTLVDELTLGSENFSNDYINHMLLLANKNRSLMLPSDIEINTFLRETASINPGSIFSDKLLLLYYIFVNYGLFRAGYLIREKAIESAYINQGEAQTNKGLLIKALTGSFDNNDSNSSKKLLKALSGLCQEEEHRDYVFFENMFKDGKPDSLVIPSHKFKALDYAYLDLIKGKSIAIVGPAPCISENQDEINSHDIIVRMNYYGLHQHYDKNHNPRTDVSYYNKQLPQIIDAAGRNDFFNDLSFSSFKTINHETQTNLLNSNKGRLFFQMHNFLFNGSANILQNALFDILCFNPASVKIYNVTFFMSQNAYQKGYQQEKYIKRPPSWRWHSFAGHDLITQINFTRNLWRNRKIDVDDSCKSILELDNYTYMSKMEEIWVNNAIAKACSSNP